MGDLLVDKPAAILPMSNFALSRPQARMSDRQYDAYHGIVSAGFMVPGVACVCRRSGTTPFYGGVASALEVPDALRATWPSVDGQPVKDELLRPEAWQVWRERFLAAAEADAASTVRPWMKLGPVRLRRSSSRPFSFLFPMKGIGFTMVSLAVRAAVERLGVEHVEFADVLGCPEVALMHILVEAEFDTTGLPAPCVLCGAMLLDADARASSRQRTRLLPVDLQVALGYGVVVSGRVLDAIQSDVDASTHVPVFSRID